MADFNIRAILSVVDKNFSSTLGNAATLTGKLNSSMGNTIKTGVLMGAGMKAIGVATNAVTSSMGAAISRFDTLNQFPKVMKNFGISASQSEATIQKLSDRLTGLPTTLDSAASGVQRFVSANGDINKSTKYFLAMNDAIVAGGQNSQIQASAVEQLSQAYSKGKMDMIEWRSIMQAMPGQMNQIAKTMGMTTDQLGEGLRNGTISMDEFMDTIVKLDTKGGPGITSFQKQAKDATGGIQTAMTNIKTAIARGVANAMTAIDELLVSNGLPKMGEMFTNVADTISGAFKKVNKTISETDISGPVEAIKGVYKTLKPIILAVGKAVLKVSQWLVEHSGAIIKLIPYALALAAAWRTWKIVSGIVGAVKAFSESLKGIAKSATGLAGKLTATAAAEGEVAASSTASTAGISAAAQAFMRLGAGALMAGAGIALCGVGIALMAQSAIALASSGGVAVAVLFGMLGAVTAMMAVVSLLGPALVVGAAGALIFGAAMILISTGVVIAAAGLRIMASAMPIIAATALNAGKGVAVLAAALIALAPGAITSTAAMIAFGAAALGASVGIAASAGGARLLATSVRTISTQATSGSASLKALSTSVSAVRTGMSSLGTIISTTLNNALNKLKNQKSQWQSAGHNMSVGLANGIRNGQSGVINAAIKVAEAAIKAAKSKLKQHSPSRVFKEIGLYTAKGMALGLRSGEGMVADATERMIATPTPSLAIAGYSGGFNADYDYSRNNSYTIEVPLTIDGREFAKTTASYTEAELNTRTSRANRQKGIL